MQNALQDTDALRSANQRHAMSGDDRKAAPNATSPGGLSVDAFAGEHQTGSLLRECLVELVAQLEPNMTDAQLRDSIPERAEFDEYAFINCMANLGYDVKQFRLAPRDIDDRLLPCLFIPASSKSSKDAPPCIISKAGGVARAAAGSQVKSDRGGNAPEAEQSDDADVAGRVLAFRKMAGKGAFQFSEEEQAENQTWFATILQRFKGVVWQLALIGVLLNVVVLASPLFIMLVYDRVISPQTTHYMPMLVAGVGLALIVELTLRSLRTRMLSWLTARIYYLVGTEIFKQIVGLPPAMTRQMTATAQLARIRSFESVRDFFSGPVFVSTLEIPAILISVVVLAFFSVWLALIPIVAGVCFAGLFFALRTYVGKAIRQAATEASVAQKFCLETFQYGDDIRATGLADVWATKYREISGRENAAQAHLLFLGFIGENLAYALSGSIAIAALIVGVDLVWSGSITTGMLVASMILIWRAIAPFYSLCSLIPRFEQFCSSVNQINSLMELQSEEEQRKARARLPEITGGVGFDNVTVRHSRESGIIFSGLSLNINPGDVIAITGATGSGKTSVLNLVQAICSAQLGKVTIDGFNVQQLVARDLRRQIAYVPQIPSAFPGSVAENLRAVKPDASNDELWEVLELVGAAKHVRSLSEGLDSQISLVGDTKHAAELSHRIAFGRVVLQRSPLTLIDEIPGNLLNSGLDRVLSGLINSSRGRRSIMFVTQRADHMRMSDNIVGLRFGRTPIIGSFEKITGATE